MKDMKQFIGTKLVFAIPMTRADYNIYRKWDLPPNENGADEGYLVEYQPKDGEPTNVEGHAGYVSWSPKAVFEGSYLECKEGLPFEYVLDQVKNHGARATRKGWNGKNMFIFFVPGSQFTVNRPPLNSIIGEGKEVSYCGHIDMKLADGRITVWNPSQIDMTTNDWTFV